MTRLRATALLLQLVLAIQAGFVAAVIPPAVAPALAADPACELSTSPGGGTLSSCAGADTYADFSTNLNIAFDSLRQQSSTSSLTVTSAPDGANVLVDGLPAGVTPLDAKVGAGSHLVRVEKPGFSPYSTMVNVDDDRPASVSASLAPVDASLGSFNWLRAADLIGQAGGYGDGQLSVTGFVRDSEGAYWVAFVNYADREFILDEPIDGPGFLPFITKPRVQLKVSGVARSTDDGKSWNVVRSWADTFSARAWTSDKFYDSEWDPEAHGFPASHEHWMRAYYHERSVEQYWIEDLIPREAGGVSIVLYTYKAHLPQELQYAWDNIANPNYPGEFMGDTVERLSDDPVFEEVSSAEAQSRWGVSREDLATYWWQSSEEGRSLVASSGAQTPMTVAGVSSYTVPKYHGSYEGTDYFLAYEPDGSDVGAVGYILASRDGGQTLTLDTTYSLGERAGNRQPFEDLRIGPDGTKYLIVHYQYAGDILESLIYEVGSGGQLRELGKTPANLTIGVAGGNNLPFLSADFDSAGNMHAAFRGSKTADDNSTINVYYQFFPRQAVDYDSVALVTTPDCPACATAAAFLRDAGVAFSENPSNLPAGVATSVAEQAGTAGYPVLVRIGGETVVSGGADVASISRLLGVSRPVLVESHPPRRVQGSPYAALQPQWLLMVVEDDQPKIVFDRAEGVVAMSLVDGGWQSSPLLATPDSVSDVPGIGFAKHYPAFPGGIGANFLSTQYDKPFNHIDRLSDFVYLYHSASTAVQDQFGETNSQFDYTLWTTKAPSESSAYRVVESVSQLIPSAAFYIALGDKSSATNVSGDLANYVTSAGEVTDDGDRFYRIVADLRARDETATDGDIVGRSIVGSVTVDTETPDGVPETREISLLLLVQNTRLRTFEPGTRAAARDITAEAVHFTGADEHWLVTNNIGLPNSIPCGTDQSLLLEPFSVATFTAADVASFELRSCLDALEVAPTVLADCTSWDDARLVLAGETITSLAGSLPIIRSEDQTNWELSYGTRDATIHRIVTLDRPKPADGPPTCADETASNTAIVVRVSGAFLGNAGEPYAPDIRIVDQGAAAVTTATRDRPGSLAWEREWLEFESATLEANLVIGIRAAALSSLWYDRALRKTVFQRQLLATRALLHCNHQGIGLARVLTVIDRSQQVPAASRDTVLCLRDFVMQPRTFWPTYSSDYWSGGTYEADFLGSVINFGLTSDATLAYLAASAGGDAIDYGEFLIPRALNLAGGGQQSAALEFELDLYARMGTAAAAEMAGYDNGLLKVAFRLDQLERTALRFVVDCVDTMPGDQPLADMFRLTSERVYRPGVPCVDGQNGAAAKLERFKLLTYGLRSGTFGALLDAAGRDYDLVRDLARDMVGAIDRATTLERTYPPSTGADRWSPELPAADRHLIALRLTRAAQERRGQPLTVGDLPAVLAGIKQCGVGLVESLKSEDGVLSMGVGALALAGGPLTATVGGVLLVGFGAWTNERGAEDLSQAWETLDVTAKTSGVCGTAVGAMLTASGVRPTLRAGSRLTAADLRFNPPEMIDLQALARRGRSGGLSFEEQGRLAKRRGGEVDAPSRAVPPSSPALAGLLSALPEAKRATIEALADQLGYGDWLGQPPPGNEGMGLVARAIFDDLARAYGDSIEKAFARRIDLISNPATTGEARTAAVDIGAAMLTELVPGPKSMRARGGRRGLVGSDAEVVRAALGDGFSDPDLASPDAGRTLSAAILTAVLRSDRVTRALRSTEPGQVLLTPEEVAHLIRLQQLSRPGLKADLIAHLGEPRLVDAIRVAVGRQQAKAGIPAGTFIESTTARYIAAGGAKETNQLQVFFEGRAEPVLLSVKKGDIAQAEFQQNLDWSTPEMQLTQAPLLDGLVDGIDTIGGKAQQLLIEEWVPGETLTDAFSEPGVARAVGEFDGRFYERTKETDGSNAHFNLDGRNDNYKVYDDGGRLVVKAIDLDPRYETNAPISKAEFYAAQLLRRYSSPVFKVNDYGAYLEGLVESVAADSGESSAAAFATLREASANLRDPSFTTHPIDILQFYGVQDLSAARAAAASAIEAFLAGQGALVTPQRPFALLDGGLQRQAAMPLAA